MARIAVKAHPRARRTAITGRFGGAYKLDLAAPPVDGKANEECVRYFAELAGVPRSSVTIVQGASGRMKVVEIDGRSQDEMERMIARMEAGRG
jgi:uncharacterized protein (TIGR00251 family)